MTMSLMILTLPNVTVINVIYMASYMCNSKVVTVNSVSSLIFLLAHVLIQACMDKYIIALTHSSTVMHKAASDLRPVSARPKLKVPFL